MMPPRDPRLCPALERAMPADDPRPGDPAAQWRSDLSPWEVVFGDGEWHRVTVRAWWLDRAGRGVVEVEFRAEGSTWDESYLVADRSKMREA